MNDQICQFAKFVYRARFFVLAALVTFSSQFAHAFSETIGSFHIEAPQEACSSKNDEIELLKSALSEIESRFPEFVAKLKAKGYGRVVLQKETWAIDGTALARMDRKDKQMVVYREFFKIVAESISRKVRFDLSRTILMHELTHAFDEDDEGMFQTLKLMGWSHDQTVPVATMNRFKTQVTPHEGEFINWRIDTNTMHQVIRLSTASGRDANNQYSKYFGYFDTLDILNPIGYPSVYAVSGGPRESFAEFAAFIAFDPEAESYIDSQTIAWFRKNVLH